MNFRRDQIRLMKNAGLLKEDINPYEDHDISKFETEIKDALLQTAQWFREEEPEHWKGSLGDLIDNCYNWMQYSTDEGSEEFEDIVKDFERDEIVDYLWKIASEIQDQFRLTFLEEDINPYEDTYPTDEDIAKLVEKEAKFYVRNFPKSTRFWLALQIDKHVCDTIAKNLGTNDWDDIPEGTLNKIEQVIDAELDKWKIPAHPVNEDINPYEDVNENYDTKVLDIQDYEYTDLNKVTFVLMDEDENDYKMDYNVKLYKVVGADRWDENGDEVEMSDEDIEQLNKNTRLLKDMHYICFSRGYYQDIKEDVNPYEDNSIDKYDDLIKKSIKAAFYLKGEMYDYADEFVEDIALNNIHMLADMGEPDTEEYEELINTFSNEDIALRIDQLMDSIELDEDVNPYEDATPLIQLPSVGSVIDPETDFIYADKGDGTPDEDTEFPVEDIFSGFDGSGEEFLDHISDEDLEKFNAYEVSQGRNPKEKDIRDFDELDEDVSMFEEDTNPYEDDPMMKQIEQSLEKWAKHWIHYTPKDKLDSLAHNIVMDVQADVASFEGIESWQTDEIDEIYKLVEPLVIKYLEDKGYDRHEVTVFLPEDVNPYEDDLGYATLSLKLDWVKKNNKNNDNTWFVGTSDSNGTMYDGTIDGDTYEWKRVIDWDGVGKSSKLTTQELKEFQQNPITQEVIKAIQSDKEELQTEDVNPYEDPITLNNVDFKLETLTPDMNGDKGDWLVSFIGEDNEYFTAEYNEDTKHLTHINHMEEDDAEGMWPVPAEYTVLLNKNQGLLKKIQDQLAEHERRRNLGEDVNPYEDRPSLRDMKFTIYDEPDEWDPRRDGEWDIAITDEEDNRWIIIGAPDRRTGQFLINKADTEEGAQALRAATWDELDALNNNAQLIKDLSDSFEKYQDWLIDKHEPRLGEDVNPYEDVRMKDTEHVYIEVESRRDWNSGGLGAPRVTKVISFAVVDGDAELEAEVKYDEIYMDVNSNEGERAAEDAVSYYAEGDADGMWEVVFNGNGVLENHYFFDNTYEYIDELLDLEERGGATWQQIRAFLP